MFKKSSIVNLIFAFNFSYNCFNVKLFLTTCYEPPISFRSIYAKDDGIPFTIRLLCINYTSYRDVSEALIFNLPQVLPVHNVEAQAMIN